MGANARWAAVSTNRSSRRSKEGWGVVRSTRARPLPYDEHYSLAEASGSCRDCVIDSMISFDAMNQTYELSPDRLQQFDVFEGFERDELRYLVDLIELRCFETDDTIVREGETSRELYLLGQGAAGVFHTPGPSPRDERRLATLEAPAVFGELGFVLGEPRTATVRAERFSNVCAIDGDVFETLQEERLEIAHKMVVNVLRIVSRRQTDLNRDLLNIMEQQAGVAPEPTGDDVDVGEQLMQRWTL